MKVIEMLLKAIGAVIKGIIKLVAPIFLYFYKAGVEGFKKEGMDEIGAKALVSAIIVVAIIGVLIIL